MAQTIVVTTDTDFASALMARGANLISWEPDTFQGRLRMVWRVGQVEPKWVEEYRTGLDRFAAFIHARKMLVNIVKTDDRMKKEIKS